MMRIIALLLGSWTNEWKRRVGHSSSRLLRHPPLPFASLTTLSNGSGGGDAFRSPSSKWSQLATKPPLALTRMTPRVQRTISSATVLQSQTAAMNEQQAKDNHRKLVANDMESATASSLKSQSSATSEKKNSLEEHDDHRRQQQTRSTRPQGVYQSRFEKFVSRVKRLQQKQADSAPSVVTRFVRDRKVFFVEKKGNFFRVLSTFGYVIAHSSPRSATIANRCGQCDPVVFADHFRRIHPALPNLYWQQR